MTSYQTQKTIGDTEWFQRDRFGMFIHWGIYYIPACGEWVMSEKEMTVEEYKKLFAAFSSILFIIS